MPTHCVALQPANFPDFEQKTGMQFYPYKTLEKRRSLVRSCDSSRTNLVPLRFDGAKARFARIKLHPRFKLKNENLT